MINDISSHGKKMQLDLSLDKFFELTQPTGSVDKAIGNTLYGMNHARTSVTLVNGYDSPGYTFITRPQLNLTTGNISGVSRLYSLLTKLPNTMQRYIRCLLDPRLITSGQLTCPLLDNSQAFIPFLTNTITTMSGWPDITAPMHYTTPGVKKEQFMIMDGSIDIFNQFDIDTNFRSMQHKPHLQMLHTWIVHMAKCFVNEMTPYFDMLVNNELDYCSRIYRLVMNSNNTHIEHAAATGASVPINCPMGKNFDLSADGTYALQNKEINIRWTSVGAIYEDIVLHDFNSVVSTFNPALKRVISSGFKPLQGHRYDKIPTEFISMMNHRGYPLVNTETLELGWWLSVDSISWKYIMNRSI